MCHQQAAASNRIRLKEIPPHNRNPLSDAGPCRHVTMVGEIIHTNRRYFQPAGRGSGRQLGRAAGGSLGLSGGWYMEQREQGALAEPGPTRNCGPVGNYPSPLALTDGPGMPPLHRIRLNCVGASKVYSSQVRIIVTAVAVVRMQNINIRVILDLH